MRPLLFIHRTALRESSRSARCSCRAKAEVTRLGFALRDHADGVQGEEIAYAGAAVYQVARGAERDSPVPWRLSPASPPISKEGQDVETITLNIGVEMPALGLGVFQTPPDETRDAVRSALDAGYRHIDTAAAYGNERQVGEAVHSSDVDRSEVFLETKIWISDYGYDETLHAFEKSARKLGVEKIDLLILHQPLPSAFDRTVEAYRALETLLADGKVRAIGVSNFMVDHLTRLLKQATVVPAVNQIEVHPYFAQQEVQDFGSEHGILTQAWSPIGGITFYRDGSHGSTLEDAVIGNIARAHGKTPAQVMLRWGLQHGRSVIPKSTKPSRITENIKVFDFELSADEMAAIDGLDTRRRGGPEPDAITLEAFGREIPEA
jgi:diketogulonate reductase-like aldo/keto reductase